jgi:tripartite-type tricarboxylate transporter receptor subunit TctC
MTGPSLAGSGGRQAFDWVVTAKPGTTVTVTVLSQKGGRDAATVTLK